MNLSISVEKAIFSIVSVEKSHFFQSISAERDHFFIIREVSRVPKNRFFFHRVPENRFFIVLQKSRYLCCRETLIIRVPEFQEDHHFKTIKNSHLSSSRDQQIVILLNFQKFQENQSHLPSCSRVPVEISAI